jgi:hypothetical protein
VKSEREREREGLDSGRGRRYFQLSPGENEARTIRSRASGTTLSWIRADTRPSAGFPSPGRRSTMVSGVGGVGGNQ